MHELQLFECEFLAYSVHRLDLRAFAGVTSVFHTFVAIEKVALGAFLYRLFHNILALMAGHYFLDVVAEADIFT